MKIDALKINMDVQKKEKILTEIEDVLESNINWTNLKNVQLSETIFSKYLSAPYSVAVSTCSVGIEMVLSALHLQGAELYLPVLTAPATIMSCLNITDKIILVDCKQSDLSMSATDLKNKIRSYHKTENKAAIILVHIGGAIAQDTLEILEIANSNHFQLIEDCAHAHGAQLCGKAAGMFGVAGIYSFFLTKSITAGEGGMVITKSKELANDLKIYRNYGKDQNGDIICKGSSWRMNEFTAVVLKNQIEYYYEHGKQKRDEIAQKYNNYIKNEVFSIYQTAENSEQGYYKYILIAQQKFSYLKFKAYMENHDVSLPAQVVAKLVINEPYLKDCKAILNRNDSFENANELMRRHLCLPIYEDLNNDEIQYIIDLINRYEDETE